MNTAMLNDIFRKSLGTKPEIPGRVVLTSTVASDIHMHDIIEEVRKFETFTHSNDPYGEHDFGKVTIDAKDYFFKIDYYALNGTEPDFSCAAENPMESYRVLTIMRSDEY